LEKRVWNVSDLDGCEVFSLEGERLGVLSDVIPSGSNDIWVVRSGPPEQKEILIPALASVVTEVDMVRRRIVVALPPGLKEIYDA